MLLLQKDWDDSSFVEVLLDTMADSLALEVQTPKLLLSSLRDAFLELLQEANSEPCVRAGAALCAARLQSPHDFSGADRLSTALRSFSSPSSSSQPFVYGRVRGSARVTGKTVVALAAAKALDIIDGHRAIADDWCKVHCHAFVVCVLMGYRLTD